MNQRTKVSKVEISLVKEQLIQSGYKVLKLNRSEAVLRCLSLFENEFHNSLDVIIVKNQFDTSCFVLSSDKTEHFYFGLD